MSTALQKKLKNRIKANRVSLENRLKSEVTDREAQVSLARYIIWKIFGFAENQIVDMKEDLIGIEFKHEIQYAVEVCASKTDITDQLSEWVSKTAYENKIRYYVQTDGIVWKMFEADLEKTGEYKILSSACFNLTDLDSERFLSCLLQFCSDLNQKEVVTEKSNRKRWYGYWSENENVATYLFLVEFVLYADSSERVHIPLFNLTLWGDRPFDARKKAWEYLNKYSTKNLKPVSNGTFETIAYKNETTPLKEMVNLMLDVQTLI